MVSIDSTWVTSCSTSIDPSIIFVTIFDVPRTRTVQGHQRSKVVVPIDRPGVVLYSTSIDHIVVSVTVLEIFDIKAIFPKEQW